jgi:hypothetical protein
MISAQAPRLEQPAEGTFYDPSSGQDLEAFHVVAAETNTWVTIFDERFANKPNQRYKMVPVPIPGTTSSGANAGYDEEHHAYSVAGYLSLVRPVRAGPQVLLDLTFRFDAPETNAPTEMVTVVRFVLFDRSAVGVDFQRSTQGAAPARVRFVQEVSGQAKPKILRELQLDARLHATTGPGKACVEAKAKPLAASMLVAVLSICAPNRPSSTLR